MCESSCVATKIKVILLGDATVGKTSLISAIKDQPVPDKHQSTIGIDFFSKIVHFNGKTFKLQFWDTAGQERFRSIIPSYVRNSQVGLIVFDLHSIGQIQVDEATLEKLEQWMQIFKENNSNEGKIIVVGNKCDLKEEDEELPIEIKEKINRIGYPYIETSALNKLGIKELEELIMSGFAHLQGDEDTSSGVDKCKSFSLIKFENMKLDENGKGLKFSNCCHLL